MDLISFLNWFKIIVIPISIPVAIPIILRYAVPFIKKINYLENKWRDLFNQVDTNSARLKALERKVNWSSNKTRDLLKNNSNSSINFNQIQDVLEDLRVSVAVIEYRLKVLENWCEQNLKYDPPTISKDLFK